jgi:hypothetical protein
LSKSARGDDDCSRRDVANALNCTCLIEQCDAHAGHRTPTVGKMTNEEVESESPLDHAHPCEANRLIQRALNLRTTLVATSVNDASM